MYQLTVNITKTKIIILSRIHIVLYSLFNIQNLYTFSNIYCLILYLIRLQLYYICYTRVVSRMLAPVIFFVNKLHTYYHQGGQLDFASNFITAKKNHTTWRYMDH